MDAEKKMELQILRNENITNVFIRKFIGLGIVFLMLLIMNSCGGEDDPIEPDTPTVSEIVLADKSQSTLEFDADASSQTVHFNTTQAWSAEVSSGDWCTVSPASGSVGNGSITVSVSENMEEAERSATVVLKAGGASQTLRVTQNGAEYFLIVEQDSYKIASEGGTITLNVSSNVDYIIEIPTEYQWIQCVSEDSTNGIYLFEIDSNESIQSREGALHISSEYNVAIVSIWQEGAPEWLIFSDASAILFEEDWICAATGGTQTVTFTTNCTWNVDVADESWCAVIPSQGQSGESSFTIVVSENSEEIERNTVVTLKTETLNYSLNIVQEKMSAQPPLSGDNESLDEEQGTWDE